MVNTFNKGAGVQISPHFTSTEFDCPCDQCHVTLIDEELVHNLTQLRNLLGTTLHINSGYRCQNYQDELKLKGYETAMHSQHLLGKAADVTNGVALGHELEDLAAQAGFKAIGVGSNWVHVDLRSDKIRRWSYAKR